MWASNEPRRFLFFVMIIERNNLWNSSHNSTHWNILHFIYFTCYKMENILSRWSQETYLSKFGSTTATFLIHSRDFFIHSTFFRLPSFIIYRFFELICEKKSPTKFLSLKFPMFIFFHLKLMWCQFIDAHRSKCISISLSSTGDCLNLTAPWFLSSLSLFGFGLIVFRPICTNSLNDDRPGSTDFIYIVHFKSN